LNHEILSLKQKVESSLLLIDFLRQSFILEEEITPKHKSIKTYKRSEREKGREKKTRRRGRKKRGGA
jgi:hypothetical protein